MFQFYCGSILQGLDSLSLDELYGNFHLFPQLTFCINLCVKSRSFGNFFLLFGKGQKIPGLNKGPSQAIYPARPVSQSLGPVSQAAVQQRSLAQWLHNLLGTRHPATQVQPAQLSSYLATSLPVACLSSQEAEQHHPGITSLQKQ